MLLGLSATANADEIKFFSGTTGYTGAFSGSGTVYDLIKNDNTACSGGGAGNCSGNADVQAVTITLPQSITATGSGGTGIGAWYDLSPNFGGMGVGSLPGSGGTDDDNIAGTNILHIHFSSAVDLAGVATLFDPAHAPFGTAALTASSTFLLSTTLAGLTDPSAVTTFIAANTELLILPPSSDFYFEENGTGNPSFYVSGLTWTGGACTNCNTPLPAAAWLFGSGLGCLALLSRRSRRKISAFA